MQKASPKRIAAMERQRQALDLRKSGMSFERIGELLGYANSKGAWKAVQAALRTMLREPAESVRVLEEARLEAMLQAVWPRVLKDEPFAIDRALKILARRAKLLGLDAPTRVAAEVGGVGGGPVQVDVFSRKYSDEVLDGVIAAADEWAIAAGIAPDGNPARAALPSAAGPDEAGGLPDASGDESLG